MQKTLSSTAVGMQTTDSLSMCDSHCCLSEAALLWRGRNYNEIPIGRNTKRSMVGAEKLRLKKARSLEADASKCKPSDPISAVMM